MQAGSSEGLQEFSGGEIANKPAIGGKEIVAGEIFETHPLELMENLVLQFAFEGVHSEELQIDRSAVTIIVANVGDARANCGGDAQFFLEFAGQRLFGAFARFYFSARKFPLQRHGLIGSALADEHFATANDQACGNKTQCRSGRTRIGVGLRLFHPFSVNALKGSRM